MCDECIRESEQENKEWLAARKRIAIAKLKEEQE
jgi:hypothetical protein